jgi:hypothetical protein
VSHTTGQQPGATWSANGPIPRVVEHAAIERLSCVAILDPRQPYLDHHRPGGEPLLGTVMGIEAMARVARFLEPAARIIRISNVEIGPACILEGAESSGRSLIIEAETEEKGPEETSVACKVTSDQVRGGSDWHFAARFLLSKGPSHVGERICPPSTLSGSVGTRDIYSLFFHGPWLRVIGQAGMVNGDMIARSAPVQSDLFDGDHYEAAPRAIEFGLQTAGLLELAETGRMMIPKAIREIEILNVSDEPSAGPVTAVARRTHDSGGLESRANSVDVDIADTQGRLLVRVKGYETSPLPFSNESADLGHMQNLLRSSAR